MFFKAKTILMNFRIIMFFKIMRSEEKFFVTIIKDKKLYYFFYYFDIKGIRKNEK